MNGLQIEYLQSSSLLVSCSSSRRRHSSARFSCWHWAHKVSICTKTFQLVMEIRQSAPKLIRAICSGWSDQGSNMRTSHTMTISLPCLVPMRSWGKPTSALHAIFPYSNKPFLLNCCWESQPQWSKKGDKYLDQHSTCIPSIHIM